MILAAMNGFPFRHNAESVENEHTDRGYLYPKVPLPIETRLGD